MKKDSDARVGFFNDLYNLQGELVADNRVLIRQATTETTDQNSGVKSVIEWLCAF